MPLSYINSFNSYKNDSVERTHYFHSTYEETEAQEVHKTSDWQRQGLTSKEPMCFFLFFLIIIIFYYLNEFITSVVV